MTKHKQGLSDSSITKVFPSQAGVSEPYLWNTWEKAMHAPNCNPSTGEAKASRKLGLTDQWDSPTNLVSGQWKSLS